MGDVDWNALFRSLERTEQGGAAVPAGAHEDSPWPPPFNYGVPQHAVPPQPQASTSSSTTTTTTTFTQTAPPSPTASHHASSIRPRARRGNTLPPPSGPPTFAHPEQYKAWLRAIQERDATDNPGGPSLPPAAVATQTSATPWPAHFDLDESSNVSLADYAAYFSLSNAANKSATTANPQIRADAQAQADVRALWDTAGPSGWAALPRSGSGQSTPHPIPLLTPPLNLNPSPTSGLPAAAGPSATPGEEADSEDKRVRNTMASAKFRAKKKQHMDHIQRSITDLEGQKVELERDVKGLKHENGLLREMVQMKYGFDVGNKGAGPSEPPRRDDVEDEEDDPGGSGDVPTRRPNRN